MFGGVPLQFILLAPHLGVIGRCEGWATRQQYTTRLKATAELQIPRYARMTTQEHGIRKTWSPLRTFSSGIIRAGAPPIVGATDANQKCVAARRPTT